MSERRPCGTPQRICATACFVYTPLCVRSFQFRDALRVGNIFLSNEFFSVLLDEREALKQMRDELCRFAIVTEPAKTTFGKVRRTYTGKIGGLNDDLAITLQLAITGLRAFYQNDKYTNFRPIVY